MKLWALTAGLLILAGFCQASSYTSECVTGETIYNDFFSDLADHKWLEYANDGVITKYANDKFYFIAFGTNLIFQSPLDLDEMKFDDFLVQVDAANEGSNYADYGMKLRQIDSDSYYLFELSSLGNYQFSKRMDDRWVTIIPWNTSSYIKRGNLINTMTISCKGSRFTLYANGHMLESCIDNTFSSGGISLAAGTGEETPVVVSFDNFAVKCVN